MQHSTVTFRSLGLAALSTIAAGLLLLCSCDQGAKAEPDDHGTPAPTSVTLSVSSHSSEAAGDSFQVDITAPQRPTFKSSGAWLTYQDGTYNSATYKMTVTVVVAENTTTSERQATLTITSGSLSSVVTVTQAGRPKDPDPQPGGDNAKAVEFFKTFGLGWNMGNHMDAYDTWSADGKDMPSETVWGNPVATQATFDGVKKAGFTSVRIPVTYLRKIGPAPDYTIDSQWLDRVAEIVGYAEKAGLKAIINTHHDECNNDGHWLDLLGASNSGDRNTQIKAEITAVWTQIANKFKDKGDFLMFESFNELQDGGWGWSAAFKANPSKQCNILNEWNQLFVDVVRATGGNNATRWLGVPTYAASPDFEKYATIPEDKAGKVALAVHYYSPSEYTIGDEQYSDWGHTGATGKKASYGDEADLKATFSNLYTKYVAKDIPVYLGEFGCSMRSKSDSRAWKFYLYYMEYVAKAAYTYYMPAFLWDNGSTGDKGYGKECHPYINHGTGAYIGNSKEVISVLVKGMTTTSSGYTLETVYNSAPKF